MRWVKSDARERKKLQQASIYVIRRGAVDSGKPAYESPRVALIFYPMRRTAILRNVKSAAERFQKVDKSVEQATTAAFNQEVKANFHTPEKATTFAERVSTVPELADIYLVVSTKLGKEDILIKPPKGTETGLTDLFTHPNPRESLLRVYDHTLAFLAEKFPATSVYRTSVENLTKARREIVNDTTDVNLIEQKVGSGLLEEILVQAADEFRLAEELAKDQPWEQLSHEPLPDQWIAHAFSDTPQ